jgi:formylglycine-generating enzyme required for sulfatase activity/DNA-binding winged helix-turn-helix (wHTH) protein/dienelactone hydrolase
LSAITPEVSLLRFGVFELDLRTGELRKGGKQLSLPPQPFKILVLLATHPSELVTREEIRQEIWGNGTFVDFEQGLNFAINKIRTALRDEAETPRYIETLPRRGYRFIAPIEAIPGAGQALAAWNNQHGSEPIARESTGAQRVSLSGVARSISGRLRWAIIATAVAVLALLVLGAWFWFRGSRVRWARNQALPEIARLVDQGQLDAAFRLAQQATRYTPDDPLLSRLLRSFTVPLSIQTTPPGAAIYFRMYSGGDKDWVFLGQSPLEHVRAPWEYVRWKISKPGFGTVEAASLTFPNVTLHFTLDSEGESPAGMVHVPGGTFQFRSAGPVELDDYWLDRYEVTNRQFKQFMERGGYQSRTNWKHEFIKEGRRLSWDEGMAQFRDSTGRIAPSTWELGSYPEGQGDFPASGISWYEAAAYCESMDRSLPTIYHWYKAAGLGIASDILHFSNFGGKGPARVGHYQGLAPFGTYDMAGNVKEWTWNESGAKRYILGGAWNEPSYMFATEDAQAPLSRSATFGFRCAKYDTAVAGVLTHSIETLARDYTTEKRVPESVFAIYKRLYSYDRTELDPRLESMDNSSEYWRREKVSFKASYGNDRVTTYLFLPKNIHPPYPVVVYFPGVSSFFEKSSDNIDPEVDFVVKSGRAVLYPVYMGTYERRINSVPQPQSLEEVVRPGSACLPVGPKAGRDLVTQWAKDLGRSIDYLETRKDIDSNRLAYYGLSLGAVWGPVLTAVEPRLKVSVLVGGGLPFERLPSEIEPLNFAPRVKIPTLMVNGRDDFMFPVESSQIPLFHLLGVSNARKRHVILDSGHVPPWQPVAKETLDWLDRYLGPVR